MRIAVLALAASVAACATPFARPTADVPSGRPEVKGNRLIASGGEPDALEITLSGPVPAGGTATAGAHVAPGMRCRIRVGYLSGPSDAQGLEPDIAGEDGAVEWTWVVGFTTTPGEWPVEVDCTARDGAHARGRGLLTVTPRE